MYAKASVYFSTRSSSGHLGSWWHRGQLRMSGWAVWPREAIVQTSAKRDAKAICLLDEANLVVNRRKGKAF